MADAEYYAAHNKAPDYNIVADSGFPVCYAEKGILGVRLVSPALGDSILDFRAGTVSNIVPDNAAITLPLTAETEKKLEALPADIAVNRQSGRVTLTAKGLAKHAASPEGSLNAIGKLTQAVLDAKLLDDEAAKTIRFIRDITVVHDGAPLDIRCADEVSGALTCVGSVVEMNEGQAALTINIRYPVTADAAKLQASIREKATTAGYTVAEAEDNKPNYVDKDSFFVKALCKSYRQVTGDDAEPYAMGGGTYARKLPNAVAFGPALPYDHKPLGLPEGHGLYHGPDESYAVSLMKKGMEIYILSLLELDKHLLKP
jgi:succinyl-diaminopimelate desuccinylase